jgi:hypothetical protein
MPTPMRELQQHTFLLKLFMCVNKQKTWDNAAYMLWNGQDCACWSLGVSWVLSDCAEMYRDEGCCKLIQAALSRSLEATLRHIAT